MRTPMRRVLLGSAIAGGFTVLGIASRPQQHQRR